MAYKLYISKQVAKFLDKSEPQLRIKIITAFEQLSKDPRSVSLDTKAMINKKATLGYASGNIVFYDDELFIYVYKADSRGDVYKS